MDRVINFMTSDPRDRRMYGGDSLSDQINSFLTVYMLTAFAIIVQAQYMLGDRIDCWCPAHFKESQVDYTNSVCWTTYTYYLPFDEEIPNKDEHHERIGYYQWVPLIFVTQAVLFFIPRPIWRFLNRKSGMAVSTITDAAIECQRKSDMDTRDKTIRYMVNHMGQYLSELCRSHMISTCKSCWILYGNSLFIAIIFVKLLYIFNVIGQMFLLNAFLGTDFNLYGIEIIRKMINGTEWANSERFPKVTLCDFNIRVLGNVHPYTVQCSLPMNLFNEIIFIFLWFWFVIVAAVTIGSLLVWLFIMIYTPNNRKYIKTRLFSMDAISDVSGNKQDINNFINNYLRRDGCLIIRMVAKNSSDIIAAELISGLWDYYIKNKNRLMRLSSKVEVGGSVIQLVNIATNKELK